MHLRKKVAVVVGLMGICWPTIIEAKDYTYYHKAGTSFTDYQNDLTECHGLSLSVKTGPMPYAAPQQSMAGTLAASAASGFIKGMEESRTRRKNFVRCMKAANYVERLLTKAEFKALKALSGEEKDKVIALMVGAESPPHPIHKED